MLIDTHAHFASADAEAQSLVTHALHDHIAVIAVGGSQLANQAALGLLPHFANNFFIACGFDWSTLCQDFDASAPAAQWQVDGTPESDDAICAHLSTLAPSLTAIGELGIDCHYSHDPHEHDTQVNRFCAQAALADSLKKPFILHTREANDLTLAALDQVQPQTLSLDKRGVAHSFTGDRTFARQLLDRGLYISLSGIVTFRNAHELRDLISYIPKDRLLVETDSPYLAPVPMRGKVNQPAYVRHTAQLIAAQLAMTNEAFEALTTANAATLFNLTLADSLA